VENNPKIQKERGTLKIQIHIAGTKRSGKTTLARKIWTELERRNHHAVIFDIDDVRRTLFGEADKVAKIGSPENQRMHREAHEWIFSVGIPNAFRDGKIPIIVATHSRRALYERAVQTASIHGVELKFLLLETPKWDEVVKRACGDEHSLSDTNDLEKDAQKEAYLASTNQFNESYQNREGNHLWVAQMPSEEMATVAMRYILG